MWIRKRSIDSGESQRLYTGWKRDADGTCTCISRSELDDGCSRDGVLQGLQLHSNNRAIILPDMRTGHAESVYRLQPASIASVYSQSLHSASIGSIHRQRLLPLSIS